MIKPPPESGSRRRRWFRWFCLLLLLSVIALLVERWRGHWMLNRWENKMVGRGEVFDARKLWLPASAESLAFSNQLAQVIRNLSPGLRNYAGRITAMVPADSGAWRRGSQ